MYSKSKWIIVTTGIIISFSLQAQDRQAYIEQYKSLAISEMIRSGIPASIKLAQAMLESNCGKSDLACKANNHFGIKCGNDWRGKTYKKEDDDYHNGELIKSCFREFPSVYDSYLAHSEFLTDPAKRNRYGFLFEFETTDYKAWAKGLSKAGYATDPQYANRLIDLIEKYELYTLDNALPHQDLASRKEKRSPTYQVSLYHNDIRYVTVNAGETPQDIAEKNDLNVRQLIRYNDDIMNESDALVAGSKVYLQPKRNQYRGTQKFHVVKEGETLVSISQSYGIRLDALCKRNNLSEGDIPAPKQKVWLKGKAKSTVRTIAPGKMKKEETEIKSAEPEMMSASISKPVIVEPTIKAEPPKTVTPPAVTVITEQASVSIKTTPAQDPMAHTVVKGDTLYSIARLYTISLSDLKKMNNLSADSIQIGQKLMIR